MNQVMWSQENAQSQWTRVFHEGHHDILNGIEDMDDIFGIQHEKDDVRHQAKELNGKKIKEPKGIKKKKDQKKASQ